MTEADGGVDPGTRPRWRWDVALSFAGAQRGYVEQVAGELRAQGVRCFYDADEQVELWGKYLAEELPAIYGEQAAAVVVFVSAEYAAREWTRLERRAALARAVRERREYVLPARFNDTPLPGLLPDVSYVDLRTKTPQQFAAMIAAKLATLGITARPPSSGGGSVAKVAEATRPAGAVRVSEADPRRLGVHAAISVPGVPDEVPPEYVPREVDAAEFGIRAKVAAAAEQGGFVLLVGGSSVGKTRCTVEAVRVLLPDWWLVHPDGPAEVAALAAAPTPRTVVWLDELQRYLDGEHAMTGGVVRALLNAPHPAVIIGTLWPEWYAVYTALPASGDADLHERERQVLGLAADIRIDPEFSSAEQDRARAAAARDPRLSVALNTTGYGLTQTLAAAPQLVARWYGAQTASPYAWAVLTAALDAVRLGARAPLSAKLLRAAAPGYCTSQQQAEAPDDWFEQALAYATGKLHGSFATLSPQGVGMGQVAGYAVADYLIQHASRERRSARVPASTWDAVLSHLHDPTDAARLADSARDRLLHRYAIPLYRHAADAGNEPAARQLARLLARLGDLDGLRARADTGDGEAAWQLYELLEKRGDVDEADQMLRAAADVGHEVATVLLVYSMEERGDLDEAEQMLRAAADVGHEYPALIELAGLLERRGDLDEAEQMLRARADAGDRYAARQLADLLEKRGDLDGLRARADAGDRHAVRQLADLLEKRGDLDEAEQILHTLIDAGDAGDRGEYAARRLAELLAKQGRGEEAERLRRFGLNPDGSIASS